VHGAKPRLTFVDLESDYKPFLKSKIRNPQSEIGGIRNPKSAIEDLWTNAFERVSIPAVRMDRNFIDFSQDS